jgi:hypothetical protein
MKIWNQMKGAHQEKKWTVVLRNVIHQTILVIAYVNKKLRSDISLKKMVSSGVNLRPPALGLIYVNCPIDRINT